MSDAGGGTQDSRSSVRNRHGVEDSSRDDELATLVKGWRERLDAKNIPELVALMNKRFRQNRSRVSQQEVATLMGGGGNWYAALEQGRVGDNYHYSADFLDKVTFALRLSEAERRVLFQRAARREPPLTGVPNPPKMSPALQACVHAMPWPAWISDTSWNILVVNEAALHWFPHFSWERNVMAWVYKYEGSRHQLVDWEAVWAPRMLMQIRAALARYPDDDTLRRVADDMLQSNSWAQDWWAGNPEVLPHPDGDRRQLIVPGQRSPTEIEIIACTPMRNPDLRQVVLVPVGGVVPDEYLKWAPVGDPPGSLP